LHRVDVLIGGGGVVGSAGAWFLRRARPDWRIAVIEPDPLYRKAASTLSASSIRRQFSTPLNIAMSAFGFGFLREHGIHIHESTYLYLADARNQDELRRHVELQRACGVEVRWHDAAALARRYPWLRTEDLVAGTDTAGGEGWFDGHSLLTLLREDNERNGIAYIKDRVRDFDAPAAGQVRRVYLAEGDGIECRWFINATGTHSSRVASLAGIELPVRARKRCVFVFDSPARIAPAALLIDPSGLWFRPEGQRYITSFTPAEDPDVDVDDFEVDHAQFDDDIWPLLAHRVPGFEALRVTGAWAGHYDYQLFDRNPLIGPAVPDGNFLLASGFSGHGLQHAPAVGRALAEWIVHGEYRSLDLSPLGFSRTLRAAPMREANVI